MSRDKILFRTVSAVCSALGVVTVTTSLAFQQPAPGPAPNQTKVVLLGTGTPAATPDRSGPATAIVVNDTAYLVDFGPGVVRRASAAATSRSIAALQPTRLRVAFVTHLHSDHYNSLSPEELQAEMVRQYPGHFVIGRDLDVF